MNQMCSRNLPIFQKYLQIYTKFMTGRSFIFLLWDIHEKVNTAQTKIDQTKEELKTQSVAYNTDCTKTNKTTSESCKTLETKIANMSNEIQILEEAKEALEDKKQTIQTNRNIYLDHQFFIHPFFIKLEQKC